ncbi:MAG: alpha-2-macroglobulin family protein, partial [Rhodanobacter sp.]
VSLTVDGKTEAAPAQRLWSRNLTAAELDAGVSVQPTSQATIFVTLDVAGIPLKAPAADASQIDVQRSYYTTDGKPWTGDTLKEGDTLIVQLKMQARSNIRNALATDLLPGGLEVENLNLGGAQAWSGVVVDGIAMDEHASAANIVHEEYRDDRYVAALDLRRGQTARVFYLVRAVTPGTYTVPPPLVEDMYRPAIRGIGKVAPAKITVVEP